jgi:16S rRNA (uracil1498-N3)-methyltransferase
MSNRYFSDELLSLGRVVLSGSEAHHLIHVMRATPGSQVTLFDGGGDEFPSVVERVGRSEVELTTLSREPVDRELPFTLILGVALPKGDRQKWLIEKAVELGVTRIVPLRTMRGVAQPVDQAISRLRRAVVEASKQCGRNRLLQIDEPQQWSEYVKNAQGVSCRLLAHPGADRGWAGIFPKNEETSSPGEIRLAVGPEGGFADEEVSMAVAAGWHAIDLGPRILRVETAALFLAAVVGQIGPLGVDH